MKEPTSNNLAIAATNLFEVVMKSLPILRRHDGALYQKATDALLWFNDGKMPTYEDVDKIRREP